MMRKRMDLGHQPDDVNVSAIVVAAAVAGMVDVFSASGINSVSPVIVLKAIASGLLGKSAFGGGGYVAAIGLSLQLAMSELIAWTYWAAVRRRFTMRCHPVISGVLYGLGVFIIMNFVVVPLSLAKSKIALTLRGAGPDILAMIVFGIIIACLPIYLARRSQ